MYVVCKRKMNKVNVPGEINVKLKAKSLILKRRVAQSNGS